MSPKKCPVPSSQRAKIYSIYEKYEYAKRDYNDYDICDLVFHVYKEASMSNVKIPRVDFVYIDEVQVSYGGLCCAHIIYTF